MADEKPSTDAETSFERLQRDIEQLERPVASDSTIPWVLGVVAFLVLAALFVALVR